MTLITCLKLGSSLMSMPLMPDWSEPVSETTRAQPRPRWTTKSRSGMDFFTVSITLA
jgi:hypothetical protein